MKLRLTIVFALVLAAGLLLFVHPAKVFAAAVNWSASQSELENATLTWQDAAHIVATFPQGSNISPITFTDSNAIADYNDADIATFQANAASCNKENSEIFTHIRSLNSDATPYTGSVLWQYEPPNSPICTSTDDNSPPWNNMPLNSVSNANTIFEQNGSTIDTVDGTSSYTRNPNYPNVYVLDGSSGPCATEIVIASDGSGTLWPLEASTDGVEPSFNQPVSQADGPTTDALGCDVQNIGAYGPATYDDEISAAWYANGSKGSSDFSIPVQVENASYVKPGSTPSGGGGSGSTTNTATVQCSVWSLNPLNWIVCPAIEYLQSFINYIGSAITNYLTIPISYFYTNNSTGADLYNAWSNIRDIALALLGIAALFMIISQALSLEVFDAYTVKKLLPRIVIIAIVVTLSWPLMGLFVGISNGLGHGVSNLIYAPFSGLPDSSISSSTLTAGVIGGVVLGAALGPLGMLSFALTGALAIVTALVVIIIRQLIILLLTIVAPLALVLYALPGGEKAGRMWWSNFWRALIMFPLIEAFIAMGGVFSKVVATSGSGTLDQIIAFLAIFLPYFMLPMTFKMAGGIMGAVGGAVQSGVQPLQRGLSSYRGNRAKQRIGERAEKAQNRNLFRKGSLGDKLGGNTAAFGISHVGEYGFKPWDKTRRERVSRKYARNEMTELMKSNAFQDVADDPNALKAALEFADTGNEGLAAQRAGLNLSTAEGRATMDTAKTFARSGSKDAVMQAAVIARGGLNGAYDDYQAHGYASEWDMEMAEIARANGGRMQTDGTIAAGTTDEYGAARTWGQYRDTAQRAGFATRAGGSWGMGHDQLQAVERGGRVDGVKMQGDLMRYLDASSFARMKPGEQQKVMNLAQMQLGRKLEDQRTFASQAVRSMGDQAARTAAEQSALAAGDEAKAIQAAMQQIAGSSFYLTGQGMREVTRAARQFDVRPPSPRGDVPIAQRVAGEEAAQPPPPTEEQQ